MCVCVCFSEQSRPHAAAGRGPAVSESRRRSSAALQPCLPAVIVVAADFRRQQAVAHHAHPTHLPLSQLADTGQWVRFEILHVHGFARLTVVRELPYILAYKSTARISRPPKFLPQYEEKIQDPRISRLPFFRYNMEKNFVACIFA